LLALGVSVEFDLTGRNWEDWKVTGWYSRGVFYNSTEEFSAAILSPGFENLPPNVSGNWSSTDKQGAPLPLDNLPPPISKSQGRERFKLDIEENFVSWMDFSFYFSVSPDLGLSLFDIRYKNKRVIYELSLQEALTHYTGSDPFASQAVFFDSETGFGSTLQSLVRGYDCPSHATYLNSTFSEGNSTKTQTDSICVFEYDTGYPIRRHSFSPAAPHTSVAKNIMFTMRTISTIGNYDFLISYDFYYDGAIEVSARASGYILAAYWEDNAEYGFHIQDHLSGSLHDHVLTFKADFDILGMKNSVQKVELTPTSTEYPWSRGKVHNTFKASRSFMASESSVNWPGNDAAMYAIVNKDTPNRFGEFPGYRIRRSAGTSHLTALNSTNMQKAAAFATHDFYITKQKDTEPRAADAWNQFAPEDPLIDFEQFLDGENIEQEDVYVHHFLLLKFLASSPTDNEVAYCGSILVCTTCRIQAICQRPCLRQHTLGCASSR
jgi:primary-amine oxidase